MKPVPDLPQSAGASAPNRFPGRIEIKELLRFVGLFDVPPETHIHVQPMVEEHGMFHMGWGDYSPALNEFVEALYKWGFISTNFPWPEWQEEAEQMHRDPSRVENADLTDLVKLLTTHVRKERFCEGHLGHALQQGWLADIMLRLVVIDRELAKSPEADALIANREGLRSSAP